MLMLWLIACAAAYFLNVTCIVDTSTEWPVREFRGVWVATVANIDYPSSRTLSASDAKMEMENMITSLAKTNFNAIIFQVRPAGDAFYNSSIEPWSYYLTGTQGNPMTPYYDPLEDLIRLAHSHNIEVHAWLNPYRARSGSTSRDGLAANHMANEFPKYCYAYGNNLLMDPGAKEVRDRTIEVIMDIIDKYDVDGIHLDDYFYPYPISGIKYPKSKLYRSYKNSGGSLSRSDWRRSNVDMLIQEISTSVHQVKPFVKFGISPFGIWKSGHPTGIIGLSAYDDIYADSKKWLELGWVDYIAPQLYWMIEPAAQSYPHLLDWWLQQNPSHRHVYAGNYASAIVAKNWNISEIANQIEISRSRSANLSLGNIQFSANVFKKNTDGIDAMFKADIYEAKAMTPAMPWLNSSVPAKPTTVSLSDNNLTWSPDTTGTVDKWAVFKHNADTWSLVEVLDKTITNASISQLGTYAIRSTSRVGVMSEPVKLTNGVIDTSTKWPVREFRGVWVATVWNIDYPSSRLLSASDAKTEMENMITSLDQTNFNAIIFQVRPAGDAFYNSSIEPWSYYLTGTQGNPMTPYYDPLDDLIRLAHSRNIEVHAWLNPYRARSGSTSRVGLAANHMANVFPEYCYAYGNNLLMDPGAEEVQNRTIDVITDIINKYDVDGIHLDDYFYPYPISGQAYPDYELYNTYEEKGGRLSVSDWRRSNVDTLIQRISTIIHQVKPFVKFGISPFGIWKPGHPTGINGLSAYEDIYADSKKWLESGWVDYIAPQLYWMIEPAAQSYPHLLDWWLQQNPINRHVYAGNYASAIVVKNWNISEIADQIEISRNRSVNLSLGNIQFSANVFMSNTDGIDAMFKADIYEAKAMTPAMPWLNSSVPAKPTNVSFADSNLTWSPDTTGTVDKWAVFKHMADTWSLMEVLDKEINSASISQFGTYAIRSTSRVGVMSEPVKLTDAVIV